MSEFYLGLAIFLANVIAIAFIMMVKTNKHPSHSRDDYEDEDLIITLINHNKYRRKSD